MQPQDAGAWVMNDTHNMAHACQHSTFLRNVPHICPFFYFPFFFFGGGGGLLVGGVDKCVEVGYRVLQRAGLLIDAADHVIQFDLARVSPAQTMVKP